MARKNAWVEWGYLASPEHVGDFKYLNTLLLNGYIVECVPFVDATGSNQDDLIDWWGYALGIDDEFDKEIIDAFEKWGNGNPDHGLEVVIEKARDVIRGRSIVSEQGFDEIFWEYGPVLFMYGEEPEQWPTWVIHELNNNPELKSLTVEGIEAWGPQGADLDEAIAAIEAPPSVVGTAIHDALLDKKEELKQITSDVAHDTALELGYESVPAMIGDAAASALKRLRVDRALDWAAGKTKSIAKLFAPKTPTPRQLGWGEE